MKLRCLLGIHKFVPVIFTDKHYKDSKHGWLEQDECEFCGHKTVVREYY